MGALEKYLHDDPVRTPTLIKAALSHVQFETIQPFLDGNGRVGRLLITFLLCAENAISEPLLYLSLYFKQHRERYYDLLQQVRFTGDWETWLEFFLDGVAGTADQAAASARGILDVFDRDREKIQTLERRAASALRVHYYLRQNPVTSIGRADKQLDISSPTISAALKNLEELGIVHEMSGREWRRIYAYSEYLAILNEGTEPL